MTVMTPARARSFAAALILALSAAAGQSIGAPNEATGDAYRAEVEKFRQEYEARLKGDNGWLTVAGLFFLNPGQSTFGSDPLNDIVLPAAAPARAGTFEFRNGVVTLKAVAGGSLVLNGKPVTSALLKSDGTGTPDRITIRDLTLWVHESGERRAIRLRDKNSRLRKEFSGLKFFPINESFRVESRFITYDKPKTVQIPNVLGDLDTMYSPGVVAFTLGGHEFKLEALTEGEKELWFIFRDLTSGKETDAAVRFLYTPLPVNGKVTLDFNKAQNPPCAYNPFTTCPLPPEQNRLRVRIEAGEKNYE